MLVLQNLKISDFENSADPDQLASDEASGSGSTLFFQHKKSTLTLSLLGLTGNQLANQHVIIMR